MTYELLRSHFTLSKAETRFSYMCHLILSCVRFCLGITSTKQQRFFFQICSECTEATLAQSLCTLCNRWLCYQCTDLHQHQSVHAASQCSESYQQQRPSAAQCPDLHQRGSSSLPPTGQGKIYLCIYQDYASSTVWQIIVDSIIYHLEALFVFFSLFWSFVIINHASAETICNE